VELRLTQLVTTAATIAGRYGQGGLKLRCTFSEPLQKVRAYASQNVCMGSEPFALIDKSDLQKQRYEGFELARKLG